MVKVAIHGAAGRMGQRLIALGHEDPQIKVAAAVESTDSHSIGKDCGEIAGIGTIGLQICDESHSDVDALIDFSSPDGAMRATTFCFENKVPLVMASTGLEEETIALLKQASSQIPVCWAPNMSLAVNLSMKLVNIAATTLANLNAEVDVEIIETHHRFKADSPSGTALKFGETVASAMNLDRHQHGREGVIGQRPRNEIGYHAVRAGDDPGQHTILFGMMGEKIEVKVAASNRDCYALGALAAAKFLANKQPGMYTMNDVLGL